jgi:DNA repair protein RecO (recombination protein O)
LDGVLDGLLDPHHAGASVVRFELQLLAELGFGLDLATCAASGQDHDLAYVSAEIGAGGSRQAGRAVEGQLLVLPAFLARV